MSSSHNLAKPCSNIVCPCLKFYISDPGPSSGASSLLQAESTRASFDSRAGNSERPTPSASVNPEVDPSFPPLQQYSVFRFHSPNNLDPSSMIYQPQTPFYQTQARPPSVTAPAINPNAAAITQLTSIMSGMNLGQPGQPTPQAAAAGNPHHPTAQQAPQFFNPMSNFAAAIAAFNARNSNFQFTAPFPPNLFPPNPAGQSRPGTAPAANIPHQQFFNPHQQQAAAAAQRRVSPPPPHATTVTAQQQTPANVSANVLNLQLPGAAPPLYNMHNPHDAHFAPGFPPAQSFDSAWLTEGAALMNGGSFPHLGYTTPSVMSGAPIMAWPPNQPPPPQIRSTQHHHPIPQASNYQLYNVPPANLLPTQVTTTTTQSATVATTSSENVKNASTTTNSNAAVPTTSVPSSSASSSIGGKDESTTTSTTPAAVNEGAASAPTKKHSLTANHQSSGSAAQQHSRPNSSGSNKGNKYNNSKSATGKGGGGGVQHHHHHQRGHSNRAPGNSMGPVSSTATVSTSTTAAVTSNSNAVASSPPAK